MLSHIHSLENLPVELLYEVYIYSGWHSLPHASKHLHSVFKCAPSTVHAEYLLTRNADPQGHIRPSYALIARLLRNHICSPSVLDAIFRLPRFASRSLLASGSIELPRRLFRSLSSRSSQSWTAQDHPLPFLRYLYKHPHIPPPDPNSHDGYALTRAVASGFVPLIRFLLDQGASPACKGGIAVHAAIRRKNLPLVKMLVEPDATSIYTNNMAVELHRGTSRRQKRILEERESGRRGAKKRKLEDRVRPDQSMLRVAVACDARDIVRYLMEEKSVMPDMQTVRQMKHQG